MQATLLPQIERINHSSPPDTLLTSFWIRKHLLGWEIFIETILAELSLYCNIEIKEKDMLSKEGIWSYLHIAVFSMLRYFVWPITPSASLLSWELPLVRWQKCLTKKLLCSYDEHCQIQNVLQSKSANIFQIHFYRLVQKKVVLLTLTMGESNGNKYNRLENRCRSNVWSRMYHFH